MHTRSWPTVSQTDERCTGNDGIVVRQSRKIVQAGVNAEQQVAATEQNHKKAERTRGKQRIRNSDGEHSRSSEIPPSEQYQTDKGLVLGLLQATEQRRFHPSCRTGQIT